MTAPDERSAPFAGESERKAPGYRRFLIDLTPIIVNRHFRLLFIARALSMLIYGVMTVAVSWQVFTLTGSSLRVGFVTFLIGISMAVGLVFGGTLADRWDRRALMVTSRIVYAAAIGGLAFNAFLPAPQLSIIFAAIAIGGFGAGIGAPAQMASTASLLPPAQLTAASALTAVSVQFGALVGPGIAGALIAGPGLGFCFAALFVTAMVAIVPVVLLPPIPPTGVKKSPLQSYLEGWRFVRSSPLITGLMLIDLTAVLFATPLAVFPELGADKLPGGLAVGWLYSAPAVGAALAALSSGWLGRAARPGMLLIGAVLAWGLAIIAAGTASFLPLLLLLLLLAGFSDGVSEILRIAFLQTHTPGELQGRVSSLWLTQAIVAPALGGLQIGTLAQATSPSVALIIGGAVSVVTTLLLCALWPGMREIRRLYKPAPSMAARDISP